jgi:Arc/MetJ-type ribon-helix-helix transcriptional regulator
MKTSTNNDKKAAERMVHVRLPEELHRRLRVLVAARDETIQDFLAALVAREVERQAIPVPKVKELA